MRRTLALVLGTTLCLSLAPLAQDINLPLKAQSTRFVVLGDTGTGTKSQYQIGERMEEYRKKVDFQFGIMLGDNIYGSERPQDFANKFEKPYKLTLDAGVKFYAALGNHDDPNQRFYKPFNMDGQQYYTFTKGPIQFFVLDSNYLDRKQLEWLEQQLKTSKLNWKIAYFHHPLYSSGAAHGSEVDLRNLVEPLFVKYGMNVVFAGHEHFYERIKPQKGITYFVNGSSAKLRKGNIGQSGMTAKGFDTGFAFMIIEIAGAEMHFQTIEAGGQTIDSGTIKRREVAQQTTRKK